jgi:hypothetical protein
MIRQVWGAALLSLSVFLSSLSAARAEGEVDLALVLAVDVSRSMDPDEQELQRQGFVEAFRSPLVHDAIRNGMLGRITVTYMEWSGERNQSVVVPWTIIEGPEAAVEFSDRLARAPIGRIFQTSISGAIDFSVGLLDQTGVDSLRRVIDISGDGPNSSGRNVTLSRDEATARDITINGLPIMLKRPSGFGDMEHLDLYYRDCVIGGQGAFLVPVRERPQFVEAIKSKIIREIAGLEPEPLVQGAQASPSVDCATRRSFNLNPGP